jgi:acetoacetate decarboxylase
MFLDDESPIAGGRELWGFPKKLAAPALGREGHAVRHAALWPVPVAVATMGYKHALALEPIRPARRAELPNQDHSHVDGTLRICELVRYFARTSRSGRRRPAALELSTMRRPVRSCWCSR